MRFSKAMGCAFILGAGLAFAGSASADVLLLSQFRKVEATKGAGAANLRGSNTSSTPGDFSDWSKTAVWYQSGVNGYWNGAAHSSSMLFDGDGNPIVGSRTSSLYAQGSTRSEVIGSPAARAAQWTTTSQFIMTFTADTAQIMDLFLSSNVTGTGAITAELRRDNASGALIWSRTAANANDNSAQSLTVGNYYLAITASSTLETNGSGGDSLYNLGIGFTPVPGPSVAALISLSAFLRRRRT